MPSSGQDGENALQPLYSRAVHALNDALRNCACFDSKRLPERRRDHHSLPTARKVDFTVSILRSVFLDLIRSNRMPSKDKVAEMLELASARLKAGDDAGAAELCAKILKASPQDAKAILLSLQIQSKNHDQIAADHLPGPHYFQWLEWFHQRLKPASYLEIGVANGDSLRFAMPPTRAVGVDPELRVARTQEAWVKLFKLTSDEFFALHNVRQVFGTDAVDLAFIDGLHTFDQALKDFINIEKIASTKSIVLFHDIYPVIPLTAARERQSFFWVGDTWKVIPILRQQRSDLKIITIPTYPSGLAVVTNLDPHSSTLSKNFVSVVQSALAWEVETRDPPLPHELNVATNSFADVARILEIAP